MTRDLDEPKAALEADPGLEDLEADGTYRTRTPSHSKKTELRSASPSPYAKNYGYQVKGASHDSYDNGMAKQDTASVYAQEFKKPAQRNDRKSLKEKSYNTSTYGVGYGYGNIGYSSTAAGGAYAGQQYTTDPSYRPYTGECHLRPAPAAVTATDLRRRSDQRRGHDRLLQDHDAEALRAATDLLLLAQERVLHEE